MYQLDAPKQAKQAHQYKELAHQVGTLIELY
jgi:hypothetical protein